MNKWATGIPSKSFTGAMIEVSKRGQHFLSQMWTPHSSLRDNLQGRQSSVHGLGKPPPGEKEARIWRTKVPRTQTDRQDNQEVSREVEMPNLQLYSHETGHQAEKAGGWSIKVRWELIPKPRSIFLRVKCLKCSNEQIVFERSSSYVKCTVCDELLAQPAGGKATIRGEILQSLS